jgi:hypothetical protein
MSVSSLVIVCDIVLPISAEEASVRGKEPDAGADDASASKLKREMISTRISNDRIFMPLFSRIIYNGKPACRICAGQHNAVPGNFFDLGHVLYYGT